MNPQPQIGKEIDISQSAGIICEACSNEVFLPGYMLRKISAIVSPNGREVVVQIPVQVCSACGGVNKEFMPEELKQKVKLG